MLDNTVRAGGGLAGPGGLTMNRLHEGFVLGGRYTLSTHIASGGMADVWAGRDQVLRRDVAVKVMRPDVEHEKLFSLRFRDEAVHSAGLLHANIATVFDYGEDDGLAYLVMELVDGQPLSAMLRERGPLPHAEARSIMGQAALALGVAHEARVVHRDVKPANILIRRDGLVKLTDFGIARALDASGHTLHGELLGTPNYMSPEQVLGQAATGASDLYALGRRRTRDAQRATALRPRDTVRHRLQPRPGSPATSAGWPAGGSCPGDRGLPSQGSTATTPARHGRRAAAGPGRQRGHGAGSGSGVVRGRQRPPRWQHDRYLAQHATDRTEWWGPSPTPSWS